MKPAVIGAVLMIVGVAIRVVAARHAPLINESPALFLIRRGGWSPTVYDIVQVIAWALLIVGIVVVSFALARQVRLST